MALYRAFKEYDHLVAFIEGDLRFGSLGYYTGIEDAARRDAMEGCASGLIRDVNWYLHFSSTNPVYISCFGKTETAVSKFGRHIMKLNDENALVQRIRDSLPKDTAVHWEDVVYNDDLGYDTEPTPKELDDRFLRTKPRKFEAEQERRLVIRFDSRFRIANETLTLALGDIDGIAEICPPNIEMHKKPTVTVAVIDVGSPKAGKLGWAIRSRNGEVCQGMNLDRMIEHIAEALREGPVALGLESPLFIPLADEPNEITTARQGEGRYPWSAGAGAAATTTGLGIATYALSSIRQRFGDARPTVDWRQGNWQAGDLLLFEAFVAGAAKGTSHSDDARLAIEAFLDAWSASSAPDSALGSSKVTSLIGTAILRAGWARESTLLETSCLVVRAPDKRN